MLLADNYTYFALIVANYNIYATFNNTSKNVKPLTEHTDHMVMKGQIAKKTTNEKKTFLKLS